MYPVLHDTLGKSILRKNPQTGLEIPASGIRRVGVALLLIGTIAATGDVATRGGRSGQPQDRHAPTAAGAWQTSTHVAATSSAMRAGLRRTAAFVAPAAGTTSSNSLSDTSQ